MNNSDTQFLEAAEAQDKEGLEKAIADGADLQATNEGGMSTLGIAAKYGNLGMADFLAREGVLVRRDDLIIADMSGRTTSGRMKVLLQKHQMLQIHPDVAKCSKPDAALLMAADEGDSVALGRAIADGADLQVQDKQDTSALRWAIRKGRVNIVEQLIQAGADVNHISENEWTPLMEAAASGDSAAVQALLDAGADPKFTNSKDQTAEGAARYGGFEELGNKLASL